MTNLRRLLNLLTGFFSSVAVAHGVSYNDPGNLTLCLDASTVQVLLESDDPASAARSSASGCDKPCC